PSRATRRAGRRARHARCRLRGCGARVSLPLGSSVFSQDGKANQRRGAACHRFRLSGPDRRWHTAAGPTALSDVRVGRTDRRRGVTRPEPPHNDRRRRVPDPTEEIPRVTPDAGSRPRRPADTRGRHAPQRRRGEPPQSSRSSGHSRAPSHRDAPPPQPGPRSRGDSGERARRHRSRDDSPERPRARDHTPERPERHQPADPTPEPAPSTRSRDDPPEPPRAPDDSPEPPRISHAHSHSHEPPPPASDRLRKILAALLAPFVLAALAGTVALWPSGDLPDSTIDSG